MIKAILAVDDKGGVSKNGSMPWPRNNEDLKRFKKLTTDQVVIMGRTTWLDPMMPTPLPHRINVLVTNQNPLKYNGADEYIKGDLLKIISEVNKKYPNKIKWVIGGPNIINQLFPIIKEFYLTRIYGDFDCDKHFDLEKISTNMTMFNKLEGNKTCHFEIWS